jgi:hypothetical protein
VVRIRLRPGAAREDLIPGHLESGGDGPEKDRLLAELTGHHPGAKRGELLQPPLQRLPQEIQLPAHPSAQDHQLGVEHSGNGGDDEGQALGKLVHRRPSREVAPAGSFEHLASGEPRRHPQLHGGAHHTVSGG